MIFALAEDFAAALEALPQDHPKRRLLRLLDEAIRRDIHFIDRHPTTLFQCLWNTCWWYDCPEAKAHYEEPEDRWVLPPWERRGRRLCDLMASWRAEKEQSTPTFRWVRSLRPPADPLTGALALALRGHADSITGATATPDGTLFATSSNDGTIRIWDRDGTPLTTVDFASIHREETGAPPEPTADEDVWASSIRRFRSAIATTVGSWVNCVSLAPDGKTVLSGASDGSVRIWDTSSGEPMRCLRGTTESDMAQFGLDLVKDTVNTVDHSPDGRLAVAGTLNGRVLVWDCQTGEMLAHVQRSFVKQVRFSPDGQSILALHQADSTIAILDPHTGDVVNTRSLKGKVVGAAFLPDGSHLVAATETGELLCWPTAGPDVPLRTSHSNPIVAMDVFPATRRVITAHTDGTLRLWDAAELKELAALETERHILFARCVGDGATVLTGTQEGFEVVGWRMASDARKADLHRRGEGIIGLLLEPAGRLFTHGPEGAVRAWDCKTGLEVWHTDVGMRVSTLTLEQEGRLLAIGCECGAIIIWDLHADRMCAELTGHTGRVWRIQFAPNGESLASASGDGMIRLWDKQSWGKGQVLGKHGAAAYEVSFLPDGQGLVSCSQDTGVRLWDLTQPGEYVPLGRHCGPVSEVCVANTGRLAASCGYDDRVRVWDLQRKVEAACLEGHSSTVFHVCFSSDGQRIVSSSRDGTIRTWSVERETCEETVAGISDIQAIAEGPGRYAWRAVSKWWDLPETTIERVTDGETLTAHPQCCQLIRVHPKWPVVAGMMQGSLHLLQLEGDLGA